MKRSSSANRRADRRGREAFVLEFAQIGLGDVGRVGGKNASLGELRALGGAVIRVPNGFAVTAHAYWTFIDESRLRPAIEHTLARLRAGKVSLARAGRKIRGLILAAPLPEQLSAEIVRAYRRLGGGAAVAVRSSATAEDLPNASFAGQHDTFLNVRGTKAVLDAYRRCLASLFNDRAIVYRERNGFPHMKVALSVGVQGMIRADRGAAGVMFTLDQESGFPPVVRIEGAFGLGEMVVQGAVTPDSYTVFKPLLGRRGIVPILEKQHGAAAKKMIYAAHGASETRIVPTTPGERRKFVLSDGEILKLAQWAQRIEQHYKRPMDIEWAKDGISGELFIVQARPETVQSRHDHAFRRYTLKTDATPLVTGLAVGEAVATGPVHRLSSPRDAAHFPAGGVLVAKSTDPDWVPVMRRASAIVTERGGRTSHAAIVSREFGLPAVVGTGNAMRQLRPGQTVTVSCAGGDEGRVYDGALPFSVKALDPDRVAKTRTEVMVNLANPGSALRWWRLPAAGIGLARMEFIISDHIKIHPMALARFDLVKDPVDRRKIEALTGGGDKSSYFIERLSRGIARLAAIYHPRPIIVRMSDFKTNEYAALVGGSTFEPHEENPMIGWRGASRYYSADYEPGFALECRALAHAREVLGFSNIVVMIPFCRTPDEADKVLRTMARYGLKRHRHGLQVYVMCEIPSNVILANEFAHRFDGFSIGSNDLTQLTLGVDRDSQRLAGLFREDNPAVVASIRQVIAAAHANGCKVGFCGQAPSDHPSYAKLLVDAGIDSISVTPDSFMAVATNVAAAERRRRRPPR